MNRECRACGEKDPARFYASQRTRFCKKCWRERYPQAGYARAIQAKIAMVKCMDCPMEINDDNHYLFDLDHRVGTQKYSSVALMRTSSNAKFQEEIAKCDLVCLMCHRKRTIARLRAKVAQDMSNDGNTEPVA